MWKETNMKKNSWKAIILGNTNVISGIFIIAVIAILCDDYCQF